MPIDYNEYPANWKEFPFQIRNGQAGSKKRMLGFRCPFGFTAWHQSVDESDSGNVGRS